MARVANSTANVANGATATLNINVGREDFIVGSIFSDQAGTLLVEQSPDGTNFDVSASYAVVANTGKVFKEDAIWPTARIRFTNTGGSTTTVFRLYARMSSSGDS